MVTPHGYELGPIHIRSGIIADSPDTEQQIDATGLLVASGYIDTHVHGALGRDFTANPESIWEVGEWLPATGVTSFVPTLVATDYKTYDLAIEVLRAGPPSRYSGAMALGLHFEGPWISPEWRGAHQLSHLKDPDPDVARRWAESGVVSIVTLAPEMPDARLVARILNGAGVAVSAGHTGVGYEEGTAALNGDWTSVTHLFNQMSGFDHRRPGMVGAALNSSARCEMIADGLHSDPAALQIAWEALGPTRAVLITDAMQATGLEHGTYALGDLEVVVGADGPRDPDGRLAGSTLTMDAAVSNLTRWTAASLEDAITAATATAAKRLNLSDRGSLITGHRADLVLLDDAGSVVMTFVAGLPVYHSPGATW